MTLEEIEKLIRSVAAELNIEPQDVTLEQLYAAGATEKKIRRAGGLAQIRKILGLARDEITLESMKEKIESWSQGSGIPGHMITIRELESIGLSWRQTKKLGKLEDLLAQMFPLPPNPFLDKDNHSSDFVANLIHEAAVVLDIPEHEMVWSEFARFINWGWGKNSANIARGEIVKLGGYNQIRDSHFPKDPTPLHQEKERVLYHAKVNRIAGREAIKKQFTLDQLTEVHIEKIFKGRIIPPRHLPKMIIDGDDEVRQEYTLLLSDLHLGTRIDPLETMGLPFGKVEESRRLASIIQRVLDVGHANPNSKLHIVFCGDLIAGTIHRTDDALLSQQLAAAIHIFSQLIALAACVFSEVVCYGLPGNHDRDVSKHPKRATSQKFDSLVYPVFVAVKMITSSFSNVKFEIPKSPMHTYKVYQHYVLCTHGDTVFELSGGGHKSINKEKIEYQANRWSASLPGNERYGLILLGHYHAGTYTHVSSGEAIIVNPPLLPPDSYHISIGAIHSYTGQFLIEHSPDNVVESARILHVGARDDQDKSLDDIIRPWEYVF